MKVSRPLMSTASEAVGNIIFWALLSATVGSLLVGLGLAAMSWWFSLPIVWGVVLSGAAVGGLVVAQITLLVRYLLSYHASRRPRPGGGRPEFRSSDPVSVGMVLVLLACMLYWLTSH